MATRAWEALGYARPATEVADAEALREVDFFDAEERLVLRALAGEVIFHLLRGDEGGLAALGDLVRDRDPDRVRSVAEATAGWIKRFDEEFGPDAFASRDLSPFLGASP